MAKKFIDVDLAPLYLNAEACEQIKRIPAADVQEVRHGKWVYGEFDIPHCSECGKEIMPNDISPFCPNCGSRMDGE